VALQLPPGYTLRPIDRTADLEAVSRLYLALDLADVGFRDFEEDWILDSWRNPYLRGAWLVVGGDGEPAGYVEVESIDPASSVDSWVPIHPGHRAGPLRAALLGFAEDEARTLAGGAATRFWTSGAAADATFVPAVTAAGFHPVRTFWHMERSLDGSYRADPLPAGVTTRAAVTDPDQSRVFEVMNEAFRGHFGFEPVPYEEWRVANVESLAEPSLVQLAEVDDIVAGAVTSRMPGGTGWINDLGVRPAFRGRGIGTALLQRSFAELAERGATQVRLNVDSENETGATRLYASVGMTVRRAFLVFEKVLDA
jgi:mycothiol synthase